jgi:hypothetical protein
LAILIQKAIKKKCFGNVSTGAHFTNSHTGTPTTGFMPTAELSYIRIITHRYQFPAFFNCFAIPEVPVPVFNEMFQFPITVEQEFSSYELKIA